MTGYAKLVQVVDGSGNAVPSGSAANPLTVEVVEQAVGGYTYKHIATATGTQVKAGAGTLHSITVNTAVASATITVQDALTATTPTIAVITLPSTITGVDPFTLPFDVAFSTGLFVTTSGATDLTVAYA